MSRTVRQYEENTIRERNRLPGRPAGRKLGQAMLCILLTLALAAGLMACGRAGGNAARKSDSAAYEEPQMAEGTFASAEESAAYAADTADYDYVYEEAKGNENGTGDPADVGTDLTVGGEDRKGQKIVYTANLDMQTLEYAESLASIRSRIEKAGGFIESESESNNDYNWYYEYSDGSQHSSGTHTIFLAVRIPSGAFSGFLSALEEDGKVISRSVNAQNITRTYASKETTRKALETELARLLEMMDKAKTVEDMIAVEARLTEVERSLNETKTSLDAMDMDVNYSTVYINLQEVRRYTINNEETPFMERLERAAQNSIENLVEFAEDLVLFVVESWPFLLIWLAIIILLVRFVRRRLRRRAAKHEEKQRKEFEERERIIAKVQADLKNASEEKLKQKPEEKG